jgi:nucleoside-diphosphate-sugar epimerase/quercetin dioxygenase-like cupin family protein/SAM-dependent methyltransferase
MYSGESRYKDIVVIDNRFVSERVKQLSDWGIKFIQGSILDVNLMSEVLKDTDILYHLAGITDVAYTKTQSNDDKDIEIKKFGVDATKMILEIVPGTCKVIFPSTHVVYEGIESTKFDIDESEPVLPVLSYSYGKAQSEVDIKNSNLDYIIVRLATVYGYSTDTMRINIMPNLFSKIASQNGTISLFSGGIQYKSLVALMDVVRCMKFLAESTIKRETFHLSNENMTIRDVAQICKNINNNVSIVETDDEIPNLGYTLSNKKLLNTGFKFLYNIEDSIREMINNWKLKPQISNLEYIINGGKEYIDDRGKILNYELTEPINLIGYIESKSGSVRANHYHPIQEQKCLLVKGKYVSVIKDLSYENAPIETRIINAGEIAVIKPNVAHTMVFLEDSIFLNLVRGEREHENYGITHTIPYILVDEKMRIGIMKNYNRSCRSCGGEKFLDVVSLGLSPLANNLLDSDKSEYDMYPLEIKYCDFCKNSQLSYTVPPDKMFDNYLYVSSTTKSLRDHFTNAANKYINEFKLDSNSLVVDIGSNDGVFLHPLKEKGINIIGIEPAKNIAKISNDNGIFTINGYFDSDVVKQIGKKATIVTASNVFAHSDELVNITKNAFDLLSEKGTFIVEVQYLVDTFSDMTFDNIYHEHVNYWCVTSINNFFNRLGFRVYKVEHIDTHGGSIRVYVDRGNTKVDDSVNIFLNNEKDMSIYDTYVDFSKRLSEVKENVKRNIEYLNSKFKTIVGYGSPAKATTALNFFGIKNDIIKYTIEDNSLKNGKFIPGVMIPIRDKEYCCNNLPDLVIVLAWNFIDEIKKNNQYLIDKGVKFISIKDLQMDKININPEISATV